MKRLIRKADEQFNQTQALINQLSADLEQLFQEFDNLRQQGDGLVQRIQSIQTEMQQVLDSVIPQDKVTAGPAVEKARQMAAISRKLNELVQQLNPDLDLKSSMQIHQQIQQSLQELQNLDQQTQQEEKTGSLKKKAEFVYCEKCGFDNGDWGFPTKDTVWRTKEELEKENPEHRCPYCGGELGID